MLFTSGRFIPWRSLVIVLVAGIVIGFTFFHKPTVSAPLGYWLYVLTYMAALFFGSRACTSVLEYLEQSFRLIYAILILQGIIFFGVGMGVLVDVVLYKTAPGLFQGWVFYGDKVIPGL